MHFDMARHAQKLAVVRVVTEPLHFFGRLGSLDRHDVVAIDASMYDAFGFASLAQSFGSAPYDCFHILPTL